MKKMYFTLISLFILFIGINKVYAFNEYNIEIKSNGTFTVTNAISGSAISAGSSRDAIATYNSSTNTLTLKEGVHFDTLVLSRNTTITSNGKETFLNLLFGTSNVTLNNLLINTYDTLTTSSPVITGSNRVYTGMQIFGSLVITDSNITYHKFESGEGNIYGEIAIDVSNSNLNIEQLRGGNEHVILNNSSFTLSGITSYGDDSPLDITNCHININKDLAFVSNEYLIATGSLNIKDSEIINNGTFGGKTVTIEDSTMVYDETKPSIANNVSLDDLIIKNSTVKSYGRYIVNNNIKLTNSYFEINTKLNQHVIDRRGWDYSNLSALIVVNNFESENSDFKIEQIGIVPAFLIGGEFITDIDSLGFVDSSGNILDMKKVNLEEYGFIKNPDGYTGSSIINNNSYITTPLTEAYTLLLNDEPTYSLIPKSIDTYTFKIINGTWEDGTSDDKQVRVVRGTKIDTNTINTKTTSDNTELIMTKTGDNEYTYEYKEKERVEIVNPKTGLKDFVLLLIISLLGAIVISYNKNKFSLFKNV